MGGKTVVLSSEQDKFLDENHLNFSSLVRELIEEYIQRHKNIPLPCGCPVEVEYAGRKTFGIITKVFNDDFRLIRLYYISDSGVPVRELEFFPLKDIKEFKSL